MKFHKFLLFENSFLNRLMDLSKVFSDYSVDDFERNLEYG